MSKIETRIEQTEQSNERNERKNSRNSKNRKNSDGPLFSKEEDEMIISLMDMGKSYSEIYKEMNEKIGKEKYTSKKIRQRWKNRLDPELCHEPLDKEEQEFILQWAEKYKETKPDGAIIIHWKDLIPEMKNEFGKLRSGNKLKNFYHSKKRSKAGLTAATCFYTFPPIQPTTLSFEPLESKPFPPKLKKMRLEKTKKKRSSRLFSKETDEMIKSLKKDGHTYSKICKKINEQNRIYTSKQIRQRWTNQINPILCHDPLDENEQECIIQWVEEHKETKQDGTIIIRWKDLIPEMKIKFGKLRSENKLKNFYYSKKRSKAGRTALNLANQLDSRLCHVPLKYDYEDIEKGNLASIATAGATSNSAATFDPFKSSLKLPPHIPTAGVAYNFVATTDTTSYSAATFKSSLKHPIPIPSFLEPPTIFEPPFKKLKLTL